VSGRVTAFGDRALLLEPVRPSDATTGWCLAVAEAAGRMVPGASVVPGLASVLVALDGPGTALADARAALATMLAALPDAPRPRGEPRHHALPARYDGPDLPALAASLRMPADALVARHRAATWTVAAIGFSPGFGYLVCDDPTFAEVPRHADPRRRVAAGSIALAAGMCAVYPSASPGGWQLIGHTDVVLFDPAADPPARLAVGDVVRFVEVP
jgi:KipI family sensor histidine kinase inhibitor